MFVLTLHLQKNDKFDFGREENVWCSCWYARNKGFGQKKSAVVFLTGSLTDHEEDRPPNYLRTFGRLGLFPMHFSMVFKDPL